jgi:hypothetical protein
MNRRNALSLIAAAFTSSAVSIVNGQTDDATRRLNAMKRAYEMDVPVNPEDVYKMTGMYYKDFGIVRSISGTPVYAKDGDKAVGIKTVVEFYQELPQ